MNASDPLGVFLASSGSKGDRLLFKYLYETDEVRKTSFKTVTNNPYAVCIEEDLRSSRNTFLYHAEDEHGGGLSGYTDKVLANLLAVKGALCNHKFEVKINDDVFVGCPLSVHNSIHGSAKSRDAPTIISFNVVFALPSSLARSVVECYHQLALQVGVALQHEERRVGYLSLQQQLMWAIQDEVATRTEDAMESPYRVMLRRSCLAQTLKAIYMGLCSTGSIQTYINKWIHISFCLPHKLHNMHLPPDSGVAIKPEAVKLCLQMIRPYHGMLLLVDEDSLLESLPPDCSPCLILLIRISTPLKNMHSLANDADIPLGQVYQLVSHLVYWNKAIVIYPLAETNVYVLTPDTNTSVNSALASKFVRQFPTISLHAIMAEFSLPVQLGEHRDILGLPQQQAQQVQMVVFLLQHRLIIQLHTHIYLLPCSTLTTPTVECRSTQPVEEGSSVSGKSDEDWRLQDELLGSLSAADRQSVMNVQAASNPDDLRLFSKLLPYFNGKHHLEQIMFYENVRRSQLLTLLDKFRDVLITSQHEDPATTCWLQSTKTR